MLRHSMQSIFNYRASLSAINDIVLIYNIDYINFKEYLQLFKLCSIVPH